MANTKSERLSRCGFDRLNGQDEIWKSCEQRTRRMKAWYPNGVHDREVGRNINNSSSQTSFTIHETRAVYPYTFEGYVQRTPVTLAWYQPGLH